MSIKHVILLNGLPRAGKDTCADYLVEKYGYTKLSFATVMKDIIANTFNISLDELDSMKNENTKLYSKGRVEIGIGFRDILRRFGTEGMKPVFGDDIWARLLYDKIEALDTDKIVVSDFRFLVEYQPKESVYDLETWLVNDGRELPLVGHASDVELYASGFTFDRVINNNDKTCLDTYHSTIDETLRSYHDGK